MTCATCAAEVPDAPFCARCGAAQGVVSERLHHFALHPGEHVVSPHLLSTLLPRLHARGAHLFRWGLLAAIGVVVVLAATGLVAAAIVVAALAVPAFYVAYLRHVQAFKREPVLVLLASVGFGAVAGTGVTLVADAIGRDVSGGGVLVLAVVVAAVAPAATAAGALLALRRRYPATLDGLVLGVAAGAGYAGAETLVNLGGNISGSTAHIDPANWVFTLFSAAVLIPLLHGSAAGLVAASLWRRRGGRDAGLRTAGLPMAVIAGVSFAAGSEVLDDAGLSPLFVLLWQAVVVAGLLVAIRVLVHAATLDEGNELGLQEVTCHHCGRRVEAAGFCPQCGVSIRGVGVAAPRRAAAAS